MPIYSAPPQAESYSEDAPPSIYGTEAIVSLALRGDENCREFLGYAIRPPLPPLNRETHAVCTRCKQTKQIELYYRDGRKRNGRTSECRECMNRRRVITYHNGKFKRVKKRTSVL